VRELGAKNPGLCVITTRVPVADVAGRTGVSVVDLEELPPSAGAELLRRLEVKGPEKELEKTSEEFGGHGLALTLLGTYLRDVCDGDVRRRREVPLLDEGTEQGGHARRVMQSYETWLGPSPDLPETLEAMLPLYAAVVHGCRAGRVQEAKDDVFKRRIRRGEEAFSWRKLGAFGGELTALAGFFDRPWDRPSSRLIAADQAWILNASGFVLRALGRLPEAVQPMRVATDRVRAQGNWKDAAIGAGNLSELTLTLGDVASAVQAAEESVELADRSGDAFWRMSQRTALADALHQAGRWDESAARFREAEAMEAERKPQYPRLYSLRGYRYCDLLLAMGEPLPRALPSWPGSDVWCVARLLHRGRGVPGPGRRRTASGRR